MTGGTYPRLTISWPTVVALALVLAAFVAVWMTATGEHRSEILAGLGALGAVLLAALPGMLRRARVLVPVLLVALATQACGASALRTHATIAVVASGTLASTAPLVAPACDAALAGCRGAAACVDDTAERCRVAAAATEGAIVGVRAYVDAVELAADADEGAVLPVLLGALAALVRAWAGLAAALEPVGVTLPTLPGVDALLGGAS